MHLWKEAPLTSEAAHGEPAGVQEKQASKKKLQEETMTPWATQETYGGNTGVGARRQGEVWPRVGPGEEQGLVSSLSV